MVIGVAEDDGTLTPDGVTSLRDKTDINNGVKKFLPFGIVYEVYDFRFTESEYPSIVPPGPLSATTAVAAISSATFWPASVRMERIPSSSITSTRPSSCHSMRVLATALTEM